MSGFPCCECCECCGGDFEHRRVLQNKHVEACEVHQEREPIATAHVYEMWTTVKLTQEQTEALVDFLANMTRGGEGKYHAVSVSTLIGVEPIYDFSPETLRDMEARAIEKKEDDK